VCVCGCVGVVCVCVCVCVCVVCVLCVCVCMCCVCVCVCVQRVAENVSTALRISQNVILISSLLSGGAYYCVIFEIRMLFMMLPKFLFLVL